MPERPETERVGDVGEVTVELLFKDTIGWAYFRFDSRRAGIDGEAEVVLDGKPTGKLLAVQVRTGASYLSEPAESGYIYRGNQDELEYWLRYSLPVLLVLVAPDRTAYWQLISKETIESTGKGWKTIVPSAHTLSASAVPALRAAAEGPLSQQRLRQLSLDKPWMEALERSGAISVRGTVFTNKVVPRVGLHINVTEPTGEATSVDWTFVWPGGWPSRLLRRRFPWAKSIVSVEGCEDPESLHDSLVEDRMDDDAIYWDGERMGSSSSPPQFDGVSWADLLEERNVEGWTFHARLELNGLGRAFLKIENHLNSRLSVAARRSRRSGHRPALPQG